MNYAAFIITYKRPEILKNTIKVLLSQTLCPSKILIVDNDPEQSAKSLEGLYAGCEITHFASGENGGPSGGAYWGLKLLFEEGWEWVLWVDDDDPPSAINQIETICRLTTSENINSKIGMVGAAGVLFDRNQWLIKRIPDSLLSGVMDVDMVAGNQFPLVHRSAYEEGILPNPDLFFGFEDLEYGKRLKDAGFRILIDGSEILRLRNHFKKIGKEKPRGKKKNSRHLWREYYSIRTLAFMMRTQKSLYLYCLFVTRCILKSLIGFQFGFLYGFQLMKYTMLGLFHGISGKLGFVIRPNNKY